MVQETATKVGLRINIGKTEEMHINTTYTQNIQVYGIELENVKSFCYLGSIISVNQSKTSPIV